MVWYSWLFSQSISEIFVLNLGPSLQPYYCKFNYVAMIRPVIQDTLQMYILFKYLCQFLVYSLHFSIQVRNLTVADKMWLLPDSLISSSTYCGIASTLSLLLLKIECLVISSYFLLNVLRSSAVPQVGFKVICSLYIGWGYSAVCTARYKAIRQ